MSRPRRPSVPPSASHPSTSRHRERTASLSIARSPSVLSSSIFPQSSETDLEAHPSFPFLLPPSQSHGTGIGSSLGLSHTPSHPLHRPARPKSTLSESAVEEYVPAPVKTVSFGEEDQVREYDAEEDEEDEEDEQSSLGYTGDFQKPDAKELLGIVLSVTGVGLLALAAGFTTIFDWVL